MKMPRLIKCRVVIATDVVVEEVYGCQPIETTAKEAVRANINEIIAQALCDEEVEVSLVKVVKSLEELPTGWSGECYPWLNVIFGDKNPSGRIKEFFKK